MRFEPIGGNLKSMVHVHGLNGPRPNLDSTVKQDRGIDSTAEGNQHRLLRRGANVRLRKAFAQGVQQIFIDRLSVRCVRPSCH